MQQIGKKNRVQRLLSMVAATLGVMPFATAATYYWNGSRYVSAEYEESKPYGAWSDLTNWSTEGEDGAAATALPGAGDMLYVNNGVDNVWRQFDLEGAQWRISGWNSTGDWKRHYWRFKNGTLHWSGNHATHSDTLHFDEGMHFVLDKGAHYLASDGHASTDKWFVHGGAQLTVLGQLEMYKLYIEIDEGGVADFTPESFGKHSWTAQTSYLINHGTLILTNGLIFAKGTNSGGGFEFQQMGGTVILGGPISKNGCPGTFKAIFGGGTVRVAGDVAFDFTSSKVTDDITVQVEENGSIDFTSLVFNEGVAVTKTGVGSLAYQDGAMPDLLTVSQGTLVLGTPDITYDFSTVRFEEGAALAIGAGNITVGAFDDSLKNAAFRFADGFMPSTGATILTSDDAVLLARVQADLNATLSGSGLSVELLGNSLTVTSNYEFNSATVTDLNDAAGWVGRVKAPGNQPVVISGEETKAVMDATVPTYSAVSLTQNATLTIAATRDLPALTLAAGTALSVSDGVLATARGKFTTVGDGGVEIDVGTDAVLNLASVAVTAEARMNKTGAGVLVLGDELPAGLEISEGVLALQADVEYDMSRLTIASDVVIKVYEDGVIKAGVAEVQENGTTVFVSSEVYRGVGSWTTAANWACASLPSASATVRVRGEGTMLLIDEAHVTLPSKIIVEDGATLRVMASVTLPPLQLAPTACLEIGTNETTPMISVVMGSAPEAEVRLSGNAVSVPTFSVATNATLKFERTAKLKNLDMILCGTVTTVANNAGGVIFGYAAAGETSYFGFLADGAVIHPLSWESTYCTGHYVYPDEGGRVVQLRPYRFVKCAFPCSGWYDYTNPRFGINNPLDEPCAFVFDETDFRYSYVAQIGGTAQLRFNNSTFQAAEETKHLGRNPTTLSQLASIVLDGTNSFLSAYGYGPQIAFNPSADAVMEIPTVTLTNNASIKGRAIKGNGNAVVYIAGAGEWTVTKLIKSNDVTETPTPVLNGFDVAIVAEDSVFSIVGRDEGGSTYDKWTAWDRHLTVSGAIGGYGDVVVSNAVAANSMELTFVSPLNTCEGRISCNGENNCSVLFADGAEWQGTVVAGNIALTNRQEEAGANVRFAALDMQADFPVRVWRGDDGKLTGDTLNVGTYIKSGGKLVPTMMTENEDFIFGDKVVVGKILKTAVLPDVAKGWRIVLKTIDGDDEYNLLTISRGTGLRVIVR